MMIALAITAATLMLVGAITVSLERHQRLTSLSALVMGIGTLVVVLGAIVTTVAASTPAIANSVDRGFITGPLVERVLDVELPTL